MSVHISFYWYYVQDDTSGNVDENNGTLFFALFNKNKALSILTAWNTESGTYFPVMNVINKFLASLVLESVCKYCLRIWEFCNFVTLCTSIWRNCNIASDLENDETEMLLENFLLLTYSAGSLYDYYLEENIRKLNEFSVDRNLLETEARWVM
jgi:hypothetical protein